MRPLNEEEIMIRAREAAIAEKVFVVSAEACRKGVADTHAVVQTAARALRDLSKPLSEIQPVDPDLIEARKMCASQAGVSALQAAAYRDGNWDAGGPVDLALAAIKRGRELERENGK